ncbi:MAG: hypothetical protein HKM95_02445, partial [Inquilinus sp.]|nr:hypothetical protein [Inquilinus sp.]
TEEVSNAFQADIFEKGRLLAPLPEAWREFRGALQPYSTVYEAEHGVWASASRPVFAALQALFGMVGLDALLNTVLTALSVLLVAAIARRLWPDRPDAAVLAAVLLATSPQVLVTGMTGFAWPAHLCLNLLWVWLFLRGGIVGHALAAAAGAAAAGLHEVHVHALFILPFMFALLRDRRWGLAAFYTVVYGVAHLAWIFWVDLALLTLEPVAGAGPGEAAAVGLGYLGGLLGRIGGDGLLAPPLMAIGLLRLLAWLNPAVLVLLAVGVRPWSRLPSPLRMMALGCLVSLIPYVLVTPSAMFGWGYLPLHGLLGSLVLLAVNGWVMLSADRSTTIQTVKRVVGGLTALALLVGLPLRTLQARQFVGPEIAAIRHMQAIDADLAVIDTAGIWLWEPLIRNDPFLADRPLVLAMQYLTPEQMTALCRDYRFVLVDAHDLGRFGVKRIERDLGRRADSLTAVALRAIATSPRCAGRLPPSR